MDLSLSEEQEMLKKSARDFLVDKCPKTLVREMEEDVKGYSPELWREMAGLGWMGLVFPEKYGGSGMSFLDLSILLEEMGRACLPGPFFSTVVLGGLPILDAGNDEQKEKYLPGIASGEAIFTDYFLCVARTSEQARAEDSITVFIVDAKSPGISHTVLKTIARDKQCEVVFDQVRVPEENILGQLDRGWAVISKVIEKAAVAKCSEMLGAIQQVLEMTIDYAKERIQFERPIGAFQAVQHHCANMAGDVEGAKFITYLANWKVSEGLPCTREVAMAKAWMNEAAGRVIGLGHQVHGTISLTSDHDLHFYNTRIKTAQVAFGDAAFYHDAIAQETNLFETVYAAPF